MAKILYAPGIQEVSGALSKIDVKSKHAQDMNMFLATHRVAATMSRKCSRAYFRKIDQLPWHVNGTTAKTPEVRTIRMNFTIKTQAISQRRANIATLTGDQQAYRALNAQFVQKHGYSGTFKSFFWTAAEKYFDNTSVEWPQGAIELTYNEYEQGVLRSEGYAK